ncbi:hypothetical protein D3C78_1930000 [compost metagenome]
MLAVISLFVGDVAQNLNIVPLSFFFFQTSTALLKIFKGENRFFIRLFFADCTGMLQNFTIVEL